MINSPFHNISHYIQYNIYYIIDIFVIVGANPNEMAGFKKLSKNHFDLKGYTSLGSTFKEQWWATLSALRATLEVGQVSTGH